MYRSASTIAEAAGTVTAVPTTTITAEAVVEEGVEAAVHPRLAVAVAAAAEVVVPVAPGPAALVPVAVGLRREDGAVLPQAAAAVQAVLGEGTDRALSPLRWEVMFGCILASTARER